MTHRQSEMAVHGRTADPEVLRFLQEQAAKQGQAMEQERREVTAILDKLRSGEIHAT